MLTNKNELFLQISKNIIILKIYKEKRYYQYKKVLMSNQLTYIKKKKLCSENWDNQVFV